MKAARRGSRDVEQSKAQRGVSLARLALPTFVAAWFRLLCACVSRWKAACALICCQFITMTRNHVDSTERACEHVVRRALPGCAHASLFDPKATRRRFACFSWLFRDVTFHDDEKGCHIGVCEFERRLELCGSCFGRWLVGRWSKGWRLAWAACRFAATVWLHVAHVHQG